MIDRDSSAKLHARREALLEQLRTVDQEIAALVSEADEARALPGAVVPTRIKPQRVLSVDHRHAVIEGGRRARHSRAAAKGLARELLDPSPGLPRAEKAARIPRLVKRGKA